MKKYLLVLAALCTLSLWAATPKAEAYVSFNIGLGGGYPYYGYYPAPYYGYPAGYYGYAPGYVGYGYYGPRYHRYYGSRRVVVYRGGRGYYRHGRRYYR